MLLAVVGSALGYSYVQRGSWRSPSTPENHRRAGRVVCWTGSTVARYEIKGVPISYLYAQYADLRRMTEWSPSLESVSISPEKPTNSVWVMRVPRAIQAKPPGARSRRTDAELAVGAARALGGLGERRGDLRPISLQVDDVQARAQ